MGFFQKLLHVFNHKIDNFGVSILWECSVVLIGSSTPFDGFCITFIPRWLVPVRSTSTLPKVAKHSSLALKSDRYLLSQELVVQLTPRSL
jgi:hypothetical protein